MKKDMPLEGLRWSRDSGSALYDTPQNGRSRTGWGAGNQSKGCYRPAQVCRMRINEVDDFCPVCQRAIRRITDFYTGK